MQSSLLADDDLPDAASLVSASTPRVDVGVYDEWRGSSAAIAPGLPPAPADHWRQFFNSLGTGGWADLAARARQIRHRVQEDGASYNVYADGDAGSRPWPLELLPCIVPASDWATIERGVQQRARLLSATLADIYGPQQLLHEALLPASLIFAHPQYLRPAHGLYGQGRQGLHIVAFDLARMPNGQFQMLGQRLQAPSGLGYLLQNRLLIAPQFQDQFAQLHVQRLAASFRHLLDSLIRASPAGERSRIVLLTPGPLSETYFEHVFLARYLGVSLVEGHDLTVRGDRLFLKTLHGLQQVHVMLRRVDDDYLDPLELRSDSQLGVPGLLQALRAGELVMANSPGTGVLESPGLAAFWPGVARHLLGEELLLPASTSWWCGEASVWAGLREKVGDFLVAPTFPAGGSGARLASQLSAEQRAVLVHQIDANPAAYTLQAGVLPSQTPVWVDGRLQPRATVLRVFALADGAGGWRVLPGALTRVAGAAQTAPAGRRAANDPWLSMQHGSASVDTWVITRGTVDTSSLLPKLLTAEDLETWQSTITSRAAENMFWLGRYTERAEISARLARLALEALPEASEPVLDLLGELAQMHDLVGRDVPSPLQSPRVFERALVDGLRADSDSRSVSHNLRQLRLCAQNLRERLSPEHWKLIQEVDAHFEQHLADVLAAGLGHAPAPDVLGVLARATTHLAAITGAQTDRMTRDDGWRLLSVGRQIERLDMLSRALALGLERQVHEADDGFALLLGLFDSLITYRAQFQARRELMPLLHLVVLDTDNPRSLAWVARTMRDRLRKLARQDGAWVATAVDTLPRPEDWRLSELADTDEDGSHTNLIEQLRHCTSSAQALSDEISRHLFVHVSSPDRGVWQ